MEKTFAAIDLKSFYASVECNERGLDPLTTNLVVADKSRTEKTICLAVSPSLKSYGLASRARLFEVTTKVKQINYDRQKSAPLGVFLGKSSNNEELKQNPNLALDFIIATPRMQYYLDYSSKIYNTYLKFIAPEDIFAYSIDEIFCDITSYLKMSHSTPEDFVTKMISAVYQETGITATAGIGTNLFLAKVAMDILAKHANPNSAAVRIASLDETSFREKLWAHTPITDFWRVGRGFAKRLVNRNIYTMGDVARCSLENPKLLYQLFGVNAELLIDHAWGWEPCTIADVKAYRPESNSIGSGQVLQHPYSFQKARLVVHEMADALALELVGKRLVTNQLVLTAGYDIENLTDPERRKQYKGPVTVDRYGRSVPKHAHGTERLAGCTSSAKELVQGALALFDRVVDESLLIRRLNLTACNVIGENAVPEAPVVEQLDLFTDYSAREEQQAERSAQLERERRMQEAILQIKGKYGKNAILKVHSLEEGATAVQRNGTIGGHKA